MVFLLTLVTSKALNPYAVVGDTVKYVIPYNVFILLKVKVK